MPVGVPLARDVPDDPGGDVTSSLGAGDPGDVAGAVLTGRSGVEVGREAAGAAGRTRVVFVDDDPASLAGLRRMLRAERQRWDMSFAASATEALALLQTAPCEVIVTDYQMPGMDGGALLELVRTQYPGTARIILSGTTDEARVLKVVLSSHQFLTKPCRAEDLVEAIQRVLALRSALTDPKLRSEITGVGSLPSPPKVLRELNEILASPNAASHAVVAAIEKDPATVAKVLHVVNSAASGMNRRIGNVEQAVALLGQRTVRGLVLLQDLAEEFPLHHSVPASWLTRFTRHATETAHLARLLGGTASCADDAFAAGLLADLGQLMLASCRPEMFALHQRAWSAGVGPLRPIEVATFGVDHGTIGGHLLELWGLPASVTEAVAGHTSTEAIVRPTDLVSIVALAHTLVETEFGPLCGRHDGIPTVDVAQLDTTVRAQFDRWRHDRDRQDGPGPGPD